MNRRNVLALLGGGAAFAGRPVAGRAQGERVPRVAVLMNGLDSDPEAQKRAAALRAGLEELGRKDGQNLRIEWRWSGGEPARAAAHAAELISLSPDVMVANGSLNVTALKQATRSIPIVFTIVNDPVGQGYVANIARPGGNITGFSLTDFSMFAKSLDLLTQIARDTKRVGFMFNPETASYYKPFLASFEAEARRSRVAVVEAAVRNAGDIEAAAARLASTPGSGLLVPPDSYTTIQRGVIINAAARYRLPAIYTYRQFVREGALLSYGPDSADILRRAASYVDKILKGANAAELPVQTPEKFELAVNLRTASTLGLTVPDILLSLADEVVE